MPFVSQDGPTTSPSGPAPARVNPSRAPASNSESPTTATSGPLGTPSSSATSLQSSLESRLRANLEGLGSPLYELTWKSWDMSSGEPICALRARARRTSGRGSTGWPTPRASKGNQDYAIKDREASGGISLPTAAQLTGWPTPCCQDGPNGGPSQGTDRLPSAAAMTAGWPTPMAGTPAQNGNHEAGNNDSSRKTVALVGWATPAAREAGGTPEQFLARKEKARANGAQLGVSLTSLKRQARQAHGWATPGAGDDRGANPSWEASAARHAANGQHKQMGLRDQVQLSTGPSPTGSPAATASIGQLNPAHSRWLMGYPIAWDASAPTATRSSRKSPRRS